MAADARGYPAAGHGVAAGHRRLADDLGTRLSGRRQGPELAATVISGRAEIIVQLGYPTESVTAPMIDDRQFSGEVLYRT
jgi:hypothetical protein